MTTRTVIAAALAVWQFAPQFEVSFVGQDLHDAHHL
jgi:hypothetical protein